MRQNAKDFQVKGIKLPVFRKIISHNT